MAFFFFFFFKIALASLRTMRKRVERNQGKRVGDACGGSRDDGLERNEAVGGREGEEPLMALVSSLS